jgi:hypothetical protein
VSARARHREIDIQPAVAIDGVTAAVTDADSALDGDRSNVTFNLGGQRPQRVCKMLRIMTS